MVHRYHDGRTFWGEIRGGEEYRGRIVSVDGQDSDPVKHRTRLEHINL